MIHGASKMVPLNYQPPGAIMRRDGNKLISTRKEETIEITIDLIISFTEFDQWSDNSVVISKTEKDLRNYIIEHIDVLTDDTIHETTTEFKTPYGNVDLLAVGRLYHVIEVKRNKASMAACSQLLRYVNYFKEIHQPSVGWLMCPALSRGALQMLEKHGLRWRQVEHS